MDYGFLQVIRRYRVVSLLLCSFWACRDANNSCFNCLNCIFRISHEAAVQSEVLCRLSFAASNRYIISCFSVGQDVPMSKILGKRLPKFHREFYGHFMRLIYLS